MKKITRSMMKIYRLMRMIYRPMMKENYRRMMKRSRLYQTKKRYAFLFKLISHSCCESSEDVLPGGA
jgi:hypothetical protein